MILQYLCIVNKFRFNCYNVAEKRKNEVQHALNQ